MYPWVRVKKTLWSWQSHSQERLRACSRLLYLPIVHKQRRVTPPFSIDIYIQRGAGFVIFTVLGREDSTLCHSFHTHPPMLFVIVCFFITAFQCRSPSANPVPRSTLLSFLPCFLLLPHCISPPHQLLTVLCGTDRAGLEWGGMGRGAAGRGVTAARWCASCMVHSSERSVAEGASRARARIIAAEARQRARQARRQTLVWVRMVKSYNAGLSTWVVRCLFYTSTAFGKLSPPGRIRIFTNCFYKN